MRERLKEFIETQGYSIQKFEQLCGITHGIVSRYLRGAGSFNVENLQKIGEKFPGIDMNWLVNGCKTTNKTIPEDDNESDTMTRKLLEMKQELINTQAQRIEQQDLYLKILTDTYMKTTEKLIGFSAESQTILKDISKHIKAMK